MAKTPSRQEITSIIPFYADPEISVKQFASLSTSALHTIAHIGLHHQVVLVDDGLTLRGNVDIEHVVTTLTVKSRLGKAGAVRQGLALALRQNPKAQFFIQSDFDGDPDPRQVTSMIKHMIKAGFNGDKPAMILGERDMAMAKAGHFSTHRQAIFELQKKFCQLLDYKQIVDPTTGLRIYTRALAKLFVKIGKSQGFGSDVEQMIIARLANASILPFKLRRARKRQDYTKIIKFKDCQDALLIHKNKLRAAGYGKVLKYFGNLDFSKDIAPITGSSKFTLDSKAQALRGNPW